MQREVRTPRNWLLSWFLVALTLLSTIQFLPAPAYAANPNSTTSCGTFGSGTDLGELVVTPLHGKAFYTDLKNGVNATYVGYSIKNDTSSNIDNIWISIENFRSVGGVSVLNVANAADATQPVLPSDPGTMPVGRIPALSTSYVYFLLKASDVSTSPQRHDLRIYRGSPDEGGISYGANYNCYYEFAQVTRTLAASANKVTSINIDNTAPKLGSTVTVTVNGATGVGGAGDSSLDADAMWLSPASVSSWPTRALRLETTKLTVKYKKQDNATKWDTYYNALLINKVGCSTPCTTAFKSGTTYVAEFTFRVIGSASTNPAVKPVAQIASGTQMKHTSTYPSTISLVSVTSPPKAITVAKAIDTTYTINTVGNNWLVKYKVTLNNAGTSDVSVDEVIDAPDAAATLLSNSVNYVDKYRTSVTTLNPTPTAKDDLGYYHFVGPFTVAAGGTATVYYIMQLPKPVTAGSTLTYYNQAFGQVGPTLIGSSTTDANVTQCPLIINADGSVTSTTSCTNVPPEKQPQTITFNQPPSQGAGTSYQLDASSSSGLPVSYQIISGPCSLSGTNVLYNAEGSCVIRASQSGDTNYLAATTVDRTVTILPAQVITFGATSAMNTNASQTVTITANSGLYVTLTSLDTSLCKVGNVASTPGAVYTAVAGDSNLFKITTYANIGSCPLVATQPGDATYGAALQVDRNVPIGLSTQVITTEPTAPAASYTLTQAKAGVAWNVAARIGTSTGAKIANNPITYTSKTPDVCLAGDSAANSGTFQYFTSTITASTAGLCIVQADQDGYDVNSAQSAYAPANPITISFTIGDTPSVTVSAVSAVKSGADYTATVGISKSAGNTAALAGTITLYSGGNFSSALIQTSSVSLNTSTASQNITFTVTASSLSPASASGSINLFATFTTSNANFNNSQTLTDAVTTVYSPPSVLITRAANYVYTNRTVNVTVQVQGNADYGTPIGSVVLTALQGGVVVVPVTLTLSTVNSSSSSATYTVTAGADPATDIIVDASYTPSSPSTTYFNTVSNSYTSLPNRTIDVQTVPSHTVTFNANLGSGTMSSQTTNATTGLSANSFRRLGYIFKHWNTASNDSGTVYADQADYGFETDLTLYAIWEALPNHRVIFNASQGSGTMSDQVTNIETALNTNTFTRLGYSFTGWRTAADGSGTAYADGGLYAFTSDTTLYAQWQALPNHTVTFDPNGTMGSMTPQTTNVATSLFSNTFAREGYSFTGWATASNGSGTTYTDGATYAFTADTTLYAQWHRNTYTATFHINYGSSDVTANDSSASPKSLRSNSFTRTAHSFLGWNTQADGLGTAYTDGQNYGFLRNLVLYAQWDRNPYTATFHINDSSGVDSTASQTEKAQVNLRGNTFARLGYQFAGWNTAADGTGTNYSDSANYPFESDLVLYAKWTANPNHTVIFDANGGAGSMTNQISNIPGNLKSNAFTRSGYSFKEWNTQADGNGTAYSSGASHSFAADLHLYAVWDSLPNHTVRFNANGGSGTMGNQSHNVAANLSALAFNREGYRFTGWNTKADGTGNTYQDADTFDFLGDLDLYAQWSRNTYAVTFHINDSSGSDTTAEQSSDAAVDLTNNTFSRLGHTFAGWNTKADGSGTDYSNRQNYHFLSSLALYAKWTRNAYTVTFHENDGTSTTGDSQVESSTKNLKSVSFTRTGYNFNSWNTKADGTGTTVTAGSVYDFLADMDLYAQWTILGEEAVTFNANGGTGEMPIQRGRSQAALNSNQFSREGFEFTGWATTGGTAIADGANFDFRSSIVVYAQWRQLKHTVTFHPNGAAQADATTQERDATDSLTSNPFTKKGYAFLGWTTAPDGSGTQYANGASYHFIRGLDLYAHWERLPFSARFHDNDNSATVLATQTKDVAAKLQPPTFTNRSHFEFLGWNTKADGTGDTYIEDQNYEFLEDLELYARWAALHTVHFDPNGATGDPDASSIEQSSHTSEITIVGSGSLAKKGYKFLGWNTNRAATAPSKSPTDKILPSADTTYFAVWERLPFKVNYKLNFGDTPDQILSTQEESETKQLTPANPSRAHYKLLGWTENPDGTGQTYSASTNYDFLENLDVYAKWGALRTVNFNPNNGNGSPQHTSLEQTDFEAAVPLSNKGEMTRKGYSFLGWSKDAAATSASHNVGAAYTPTSDGETFYAVWRRDAFKVHYKLNYGTSATTDAAIQEASETKQLTPASPSRAHYKLLGWTENPDGTGQTFSAATTYDFLENLDVYAKWGALLTVNFNRNNGIGSPEYTAVEQTDIDATVSLSTQGTMDRTGYTFLGWSKDPAATTAEFVEGDTYTPTSNNETFYAVWVAVRSYDQGINGLTWLDFNGDGVQQVDEPNLPGLPLGLTEAVQPTRFSAQSVSLNTARTISPAAVSALLSDKYGRYGMSVAAGTWTATFTIPQILSITQTSVGSRTASITIDVPAGSTAELWLAVNSSTSTSIRSRIYNANGELVEGSIIVTWDGIDAALNTTDDVTFPINIINGEASLENLPAGQYQVIRMGATSLEPGCVGFNIAPAQQFNEDLRNIGCTSLAYTGGPDYLNSITGLGLLLSGSGLAILSRRRRTWLKPN